MRREPVAPPPRRIRSLLRAAIALALRSAKRPFARPPLPSTQPVSDDDVGWLKNPDEYFYGSQQMIQRASVRKILNAVVKDLAWNPDRRFSYVEGAFFERYWDELDTRTADLVRSHVASGQLEFINGGWSMCVGSAALCGSLC